MIHGNWLKLYAPNSNKSIRLLNEWLLIIQTNVSCGQNGAKDKWIVVLYCSWIVISDTWWVACYGSFSWNFDFHVLRIEKRKYFLNQFKHNVTLFVVNIQGVSPSNTGIIGCKWSLAIRFKSILENKRPKTILYFVRR